MAQIETFSGTYTDFYTWLITKLRSMHSFVRVEDDAEDENAKDLYYTNSSYIKVSHVQSNQFSISAHTPGGRGVSLFSYLSVGSVAATIVKTATNDILVKIKEDDTNPSNAIARLVLAKCRNAITGNDEWAVYNFKKEQYIDSSWNPIGYVLTDDTCPISSDPDGGSCNFVQQTAETNLSHILTGYNGFASMTLLIPVCSVASSYIGKTTYMILFTPQYYDGPVVINSKRYYACNHLFMLDE